MLSFQDSLKNDPFDPDPLINTSIQFSQGRIQNFRIWGGERAREHIDRVEHAYDPPYTSNSIVKLCFNSYTHTQ